MSRTNRMNRGAWMYQRGDIMDFVVEPGDTPIRFVNTVAPVLSRFYAASSTETTHDAILARIAATKPASGAGTTVNSAPVIKFDGEGPDAPSRLLLTMHGRANEDEKIAESIYGYIRGWAQSVRPTISVYKLADVVYTLSSATHGGSSQGGGVNTGTQLVPKSAAVTTANVLEGVTNNLVAVRAFGDGVMAGVCVPEIGPFHGIIRTPVTGAGADASAGGSEATMLLARWW